LKKAKKLSRGFARGSGGGMRVCMTAVLLTMLLTTNAFCRPDMWTVANDIIVDVYTKIAGNQHGAGRADERRSCIGAKLSNNQHKVYQAWDWLKPHLDCMGPSSWNWGVHRVYRPAV
jgi:hypothetical protein